MEARKEGLDVSLFRRLSEAHPEAVVDLLFQYRMNADIMLLSNRLIYNNRLSCGCDEVADRTLKLPNKLFLKKSHSDHGLNCGTNCWLEALVNERFVFFLSQYSRSA
jgi:DNA replication ATP-dependent helicase Dna2